MSAMELFDSQVRFGESLFGYRLDRQTLLNQMDRLDIRRAVLCPVRPPAYHFAPANEAVAQAVAADPDRFVGFARIDPWQGEQARAELMRATRDLRLRGLFLDPWEDHFAISHPMVHPLIEQAEALHLPVMLAGGYPVVSHPSQIRAMAERFPNVTFITTHAGQLNISGLLLGEAADMMRACPNVVAQTSGVYREDFIEECVAEFGPSRVLFGSGAPIFDQAFETLRIHMAHLSDEVKREIGAETLARILGEG